MLPDCHQWMIQTAYNAKCICHVKLVTERQYSLLVVVILLTTLVASLLLKHYFNRLPKEQVKLDDES